MTYLEMRAAISALELKYKTERAAIVEAYNALDRTAIKANRARIAREARSNQTLERSAREYIVLWDTLPSKYFPCGYAANRGKQSNVTARQLSELIHACSLEPLRYRWDPLIESVVRL